MVRAAADVFGRRIEIETLPWGADHFLATGVTIPTDGYARLREFDAVFIGALGDPRVPDNRHARDILLGTRFELDLYVNYRPVRLLDERLCPLKDRTPADVELRGVSREHRRAVRWRRRPVQGRDARRSGAPGRDQHLQGRPPDPAPRVRLRPGDRPHTASAWPTRATPCPMATRCGSACSPRSRRSTRDSGPPSVYRRAGAVDGAESVAVRGDRHQQPVRRHHHGSRRRAAGRPGRGRVRQSASGPDVDVRAGAWIGAAARGKNVANPIGAILSAAMMLDYLGARDEAAAIESAVEQAVRDRQGTADIGGALGTRETGDYVAGLIAEAVASERASEPRERSAPAQRRADTCRRVRGAEPFGRHGGASATGGDDRRRRAHADDRLRGRAQGHLGARARGDRGARRVRADRRQARVGRSRRRRQRAADQRGRHLWRTARRPEGWRADRSAGADGQPPVRVGHPGRGERRPADSARRGRDGVDRRDREHEPGAARHPRASRRPEARSGQARGRAVGSTGRHPLRLLDGDHRRELRVQVRHLANRAGRIRAAKPAAGRSCLDRWPAG